MKLRELANFLLPVATLHTMAILTVKQKIPAFAVKDWAMSYGEEYLKNRDLEGGAI